MINHLKSVLYSIKKKHSAHYAEELYVNLQLSKSLPSREYAIISDLLLPNDGQIRTSQIDQLIVSPYGIFCIETKSHKGWILASKARKVFTQILYKKRYPITPNPVQQNNGHIKTINALLGSRLKAPIINIVVFPSVERFFIDGYENVGSVNDMINSIFEHSSKTYSYGETVEIIEIICKFNIKKPIEHVKHIERVKAVHAHV